MGFFKSLNDVQKQAKEIQKDWDGPAQRQNALERMAGAQAMMAAQTKAANIAATGVEATAAVAVARQTGAQVNLEPVVELELTVMPAGLPPYPVTLSQPVSPVNLARIQPGSTLVVKVDPNDPASVWIDFMRSAS
jgi:hypothetical protein